MKIKAAKKTIRLTLDHEEASRLHDLLVMTWFPKRHEQFDDKDALVVDEINNALYPFLRATAPKEA